MSSKDLPVGFEQVPCEICGHDERVLVTSRTDLFLGGHDVFYMHKCQKCGVLYQHPRPAPEKINEFYPSDYVAYTPAVRNENKLSRFFRRYGLRKRADLVTTYLSHGKLLDVGCATGDFLLEMQQKPNWQLTGIEPSQVAAAYVRKNTHIDVIEGFLNNAPFANQSFDAITMWDVIEHVYDPRDVIDKAAKLLRTGGILIVNHPNLDSIDARLFSMAWAGYELPRHLYLFPTDILRNLMAERGLRELKRICLYGSHGAAGTSLTFATAQRFGYGRFSKFIHKLLLSKVARLLFFPYFRVIDHFTLGSNVTVVFQKTK